MSVVRKGEIRSTGPTWDHWPASLPQLAYVVKDGGFLCVACANGGNGSRAGDILDPSCPDDDQWRVVGGMESDGSERFMCAHCQRQIPAGQ
jgi:hypothetical protein